MSSDNSCTPEALRALLDQNIRKLPHWKGLSDDQAQSLSSVFVTAARWEEPGTVLHRKSSPINALIMLFSGAADCLYAADKDKGTEKITTVAQAGTVLFCDAFYETQNK
jgi:hypothetical protein